MSGLLAFASPAVLFALLALPAIWWLLRLTPPRPKAEIFPPLAILATVLRRDETAAKSPWWLTLLRMALAAAVILALAGPVLNPRAASLETTGPLALVIDNGWASAPDWQARLDAASERIDEAQATDLPVALAFTADASHDAAPKSAAEARQQLAAATVRPLVPDRAAAARALAAALAGNRPGTLTLISDGIAAAGDDEAATVLGALGAAATRLVIGSGESAVAITSAQNGTDALTVEAARLSREPAAGFTLHALDAQGRSLASGRLDFAAGAATASASITAPFELRNDFARLSIETLATAGATHLLDDGFRRRRVALIAGEGAGDVQPLLQPLYYISRALQPFADVVTPSGADLAATLREALAANPAVIITADIGRLPQEMQEPLRRFVAEGGMLLRFAGPRLAAAAADDPLLPVRLRQGERALGGTLSWSQPQPLAAFPAIGPFAGMPEPGDVTVNRQVLAEPAPDLAERTWASLADGTPFVTGREIGAGRIVLFHVSAEASWSSLPLSGHFVDMLRRLVQLARAPANANAATGPAGTAATLAPWRLLTADGRLTAETANARPLAVNATATPVAGFDNPPGLYGSEDGFTAVNLLPRDTILEPFSAQAETFAPVREPLAGAREMSLKPALLALALLLLLADSVIMLALKGAFPAASRRRAGGIAALAAIALTAAALSPAPLAAQDGPRAGDEAIVDRLDSTRLAYVRTGESEQDTVSERGLAGLSEFLTWRTALEPGAPVGLDLETDELAFYPIIYWPVSASAPMPSQRAIARIDAYMRNGGTVLFDTRDQIASMEGLGATPNGERLQAILADIDIPPLEPVPQDHVLTRAFFLLSQFPGRYLGGPLWVEARQEARESGASLASGGDGVSPILITGNDFAGAWAVDTWGTPLLPTVPPDEMQRELAYRSGVNIMMYMLTGNYKADQVHVPALLERLGQ